MPAPLKQRYRFLPAATWNCGIDRLSSLNGNTVLRRYSWQPAAVGLDVPISVYDAAANASYSYATDANKNVSDLTDANGNVVAHYEYSPFGQQTKVTGTYASSNPFRFSSEYYDAETGLVYYNHRYYYAKLGRWLSRDSIGENGEINLYYFVKNDTTKSYDVQGLNTKKCCSDNRPPCPTKGKVKIRETKEGDTEYRTKRQAQAPIANGCGPYGWDYSVPDFVFEGACNNHDICWGTCGSSQNACDQRFLADMQNACRAAHNGGNVFSKFALSRCLELADIYYRAVSGNEKHFEESQDEACAWEKCCPHGR